MSAITLIKNIINDSLAEGSVLGSLQLGKMTLIDKKKPSLDVTKNHSETLKQDMWKGRFLQPGPGWVQAQMFKCKLCTNDLVCAKDNHKEEHCICLDFCDIAKAYDTKCRELLYTKLRQIGLVEGWWP